MDVPKNGGPKLVAKEVGNTPVDPVADVVLYVLETADIVADPTELPTLGALGNKGKSSIVVVEAVELTVGGSVSSPLVEP